MTKATHKLFALNAQPVLEFINANPWIWTQSAQRQNRIAPFYQTESALILYNESNALSYIPHFNADLTDLFRLIIPCLSEIEARYPSGYWCKALLAKLKPGGEVKSHFDKGWPLAYEHRFHWVITTNPGVHINVNQRNFKFGANEVWEINNREVHSVVNSGNTERIHLIADWVPDPKHKMHYWQPYLENSPEDLFFQTVDKARARWGSANNPLY